VHRISSPLRFNSVDCNISFVVSHIPVYARQTRICSRIGRSKPHRTRRRLYLSIYSAFIPRSVFIRFPVLLKPPPNGAGHDRTRT
jgi:hypothetical protein